MRDENLPLRVFIDLQKAYDSDDRELMWELLARFDVPAIMLAVIRQITRRQAGPRAHGQR